MIGSIHSLRTLLLVERPGVSGGSANNPRSNAWAISGKTGPAAGRTGRPGPVRPEHAQGEGKRRGEAVLRSRSHWSSVPHHPGGMASRSPLFPPIEAAPVKGLSAGWRPAARVIAYRHCARPRPVSRPDPVRPYRRAGDPVGGALRDGPAGGRSEEHTSEL